jgi:hypothetical protein
VREAALLARPEEFTVLAVVVTARGLAVVYALEALIIPLETLRTGRWGTRRRAVRGAAAILRMPVP